jgi:hypothetical protein
MGLTLYIRVIDYMIALIELEFELEDYPGTLYGIDLGKSSDNCFLPYLLLRFGVSTD